MSTRIPSIISVVLTVLLLIVLSVLFLFANMVLLNGVSERQGTIALGASAICQIVSLILSAVLSGWLSRTLITKSNWNQIVAVIVAVIAGTTLGGILTFLSVLISIPIAGIS